MTRTRLTRLYLGAASSALITLAVWIIGSIAFELANCTTYSKGLACDGPQWVWWLVAIGTYWVQWAAFISVPLSAVLLAFAGAIHYGESSGSSRQADEAQRPKP